MMDVVVVVVGPGLGEFGRESKQLLSLHKYRDGLAEPTTRAIGV